MLTRVITDRKALTVDKGEVVRRCVASTRLWAGANPRRFSVINNTKTRSFPLFEIAASPPPMLFACLPFAKS
jgi:hypothetical protein